MHMIRSGQYAGKNIVLVDRDPKQSNDHTWCFWEKEEGLFEPVVFRRWQQLAYHDEGFDKQLGISPYHYKMIRGEDFYRYCLTEISRHPNFQFVQGSVDEVFQEKEKAFVRIDGHVWEAETVFNSILPKIVPGPKDYMLLQHFKGWVVETEGDAFDPAKATLMDFRQDQRHGTAFCYVLPFDERKALVEYTLFSPALLPQDQYDKGLKRYIEEVLGLKNYNVLDTEFGVIPMTNYRFPKGEGRIVNIGTAGGQTKASSGYTFQFIQKHSAFLAKHIASGDPLSYQMPPRFRFYDSVLLKILHRQTLPGHRIFTTLFKKNPAAQVLKFLDNETRLGEEVGIISSLPMWPFLKAALRS
jgi:lycopene beta-cyclase